MTTEKNTIKKLLDGMDGHVVCEKLPINKNMTDEDYDKLKTYLEMKWGIVK